MSTVSTPAHGDLMVFAPGSCGADKIDGHVAVVDTVGSTTVAVVEEHPAGSSTYKKNCASCWLHADANPCWTAPSNGLYCGQSTQLAGGTKDVLYDCQWGSVSSMTTCAYGCIVEAPGTGDKCATPPDDAGSKAAADSSPEAGPDVGANAASPASEADATDARREGANEGGGCCVACVGESESPGAAGIALGALLGFACVRRRRA